MINTLAYHNNSSIMDKKSFITLGPGLVFFGKAGSFLFECCTIKGLHSGGNIRLGRKSLTDLAYYSSQVSAVLKRFIVQVQDAIGAFLGPVLYKFAGS